MIKGCINLWVRAPYPNSLLCQVLGFYFYALKNTSTPAPAPEKIPDTPAYQEHHPHRPAPPPPPLPLLIFQFFLRKANIFVTRLKILKKHPPSVFLKNSQNWKQNRKPMFSIALISHPRLTLHFNFQFTRSYFWIWNICFHIASAHFTLSINCNFVRS